MVLGHILVDDARQHSKVAVEEEDDEEGEGSRGSDLNDCPDLEAGCCQLLASQAERRQPTMSRVMVAELSRRQVDGPQLKQRRDVCSCEYGAPPASLSASVADANCLIWADAIGVRTIGNKLEPVLVVSRSL